MNLRIFRTPAAFVISTALLASHALAQGAQPAAPSSPYGGETVEEIIVRINDQIISRSDYERAMKEMDGDARQHGASMQEISAGHKDLLRNLIDQQLLLSKGKDLGFNGETETIKRLDEIRKQYHLESMEELEKSAKEQGISFEDFKANIRNGAITQEVIRQEVGKRVQFTPGEAERYFEAHKKDYERPESVTLAEILVSTGADSAATSAIGGAAGDDQAKLAAAKSKADDLEAKLHAGGDFAQLARTFSDGQTAAEGGDMGQYKRGELAKVIEDATFALKTGEYTEPIHTKQGYVILKVVQHVPGGVPAYKDVADQVQENFFSERMEPAMRGYLTELREQAFIDIKPGYTDSGASAKETKPLYSAYVPPAPKKKKKIERTRFRESTHTYRQKQKAPPAAEPAAAEVPAVATVTSKKGRKKAGAERDSLKPGKKEKIRYGKAPSRTLPSAPESPTEDAGATSPSTNATVAAAEPAPEPVNPLETKVKPTHKTRISARVKTPGAGKVKGDKTDKMAPVAPDSSEVADRQVQSGPLGLSGDTAPKKKKHPATTTGDKTRMADKNKKKAAEPGAGETPQAPAAPAQ